MHEVVQLVNLYTILVAVDVAEGVGKAEAEAFW